MDTANGYWYLQHLSSNRRLILQSGETLVGRHSQCKLQLNGYEYVSRQHAKFFVSQENTVSLKQLNSPNGVYVNKRRLQENENRILRLDDKIGFGVIVASNVEVSPNYAIFSLKYMELEEEDIVLISDDESEITTPHIPDTVNECNINDVKPEATNNNNDTAEDNNNVPINDIISPPKPNASPTEHGGIHLPQIPEVKQDDVISPPKPNASPTEHRGIHLPQIPEVKQEYLSQASKEIENIFGEPDKEFLESVFHVNPYVYKQLNNGNDVTNGEKIRDGDIIELPEDASIMDNIPQQPSESNPPSPQSIDSPKREKANASDDFDENFALSQAVLREMKEEMAEASEEELDNEDDADFRQETSWVKAEMATQLDEDEIIVIEDDDDELYSKVAGWSSKLLSQVYPLDLDDDDVATVANNDSDNESQLSEFPFFKNRSKPMRIESSSSEDEPETTDLTYKATLHKSMLRECHVKLKSVDVSQFPEINDPFKSEADNNQSVLDVVLEPSTLQISESNESTPKKNSASRKRKKTVSERSETKTPNKQPNTIEEETPARKRSSRLQNRSKSCYEESPFSSPTRSSIPNEYQNNAKKLPTESTPKKRSPRLQNRPKSCYTESPLSSPTRQPQGSTEDLYKSSKLAAEKTPTSTPKEVNSRLRNRSKSCYFEAPATSSSTENLDKPKKLPAEKTKSLSPTQTTTDDFAKPKKLHSPVVKLTSITKKVSPRLQNRSKSCLIESPSPPSTSKTSTTMDKDILAPPDPTEKEPTPSIKNPVNWRMLNRSKSVYMERPNLSPADVQNVLGPKIIEAPHLPSGRGKLRGVSAEGNQNRRKNDILERQRSADYQAEMQKKWFQKPKDKKLECEQIKERRREELKKIAEKPKPVDDRNVSAEPKRKQTGVPTLGNCNRGEFLTKELLPTTPKKRKLNNVPAKPPMRRATIDSFSQQLKAADNVVKSPPTHYSRVPERKDAQIARNQRTCNRVTFAQMDRDFEFGQRVDKRCKRSRHVRFNDDLQIRFIERIGRIKVGFKKDTQKLSLSTYKERREWAHAQGKLENFSDLIMGNILDWANQWLRVRSVDAVAANEVLVPIPDEFDSIKQYREIIVPLMKIELLAGIERDYELSIDSFEVKLQSAAPANQRHRPRFVLTTTYTGKLEKRFDLFTIYSGKTLKKSFANMPRPPLRINGETYELRFEILQQKDITLEMLQGIKTLTVRPVIDNIRVEMGAFNAIYLLRRSPLFQRILQPSENVLSFDNKLVPQTKYKGFTKLNEHQTDICKRTWIRMVDDSTPSITLIQGPPGTGKSSVIANLTLQCMYGTCNQMLDRKILICAPSNAAVDNITMYLICARSAMRNNKFEVMRFGQFDKINAKVHDITLHHLLKRKRDEKRQRLTDENIQNLTNHKNRLISEIDELKIIAGQMNYMQQKLNDKKRELRLIEEQLHPPLTLREEHEYSVMYLKRANIVCTTLSSCVKLATFIDYFDACIIDEATQCTEPQTLLPLRFGVRSLVLVGDTQQLPATVMSQRATDFGLGNSMFDRIQRNLQRQLDKPRGNHFVHTKIFKLSMQYRMHPDICRFPNGYFYDNQLINADCTKHLISPFIPYCVINLSYTQDTNDANNRSISNDEEARFVAKLLVEMNKHMPAERYKYGLITPYSNHCYTLNQVIPSHMKIVPQTVDAYQGQERDVIIVSNARTRGAGFLANYQRLNVAITRPKRCLVLCGNFDDLQNVQLYRDLLNDARKRNVYFDLQRRDVLNINKSLISKMLVKPIEVPE